MATSAVRPLIEQSLLKEFFRGDDLLGQPLVAGKLLNKRKNNRNIRFSCCFDLKSWSVRRNHVFFPYSSMGMKNGREV